MHTWHWQTWNDLPYLTCSLLESWQHGFFTQQFSPRSPFLLTEVLNPNAKTYRVQQVHGNRVLAPSEMPDFSAENLLAGDGLITDQANQAVWICSADCTPVLIADAKTGNVSAIHAGWRGTSQKIVPLAVARLCAQGSQLPDLRIAMGPAIAGEVYQVSTHVALEVGATVLAIDPDSPLEASVEQLLALPNSPILTDSAPGRVRLDVRQVNALQIEQLGISSEQVAIAPYCTYQDATNFFSYRREKLKKAQWSGIVSQNTPT
ncbi:peptidoglycan editing factor PgeF [Phormidesmis priestleyi]